jgi:hypothetical protein
MSSMTQKEKNCEKLKKQIAKLPPIKLSVKGKHPGGRPTKYTEELANRICDAVATTTDGMRRMCANNEGFPTCETLMQWRYKYPEFSAHYAQAKLIQADLFAEQIIDICDEPQLTSEAIQQARLRVDTRKWLTSKLIPKIYGDRVHSESTVSIKHEDALELLK